MDSQVTCSEGLFPLPSVLSLVRPEASKLPQKVGWLQVDVRAGGQWEEPLHMQLLPHHFTQSLWERGQGSARVPRDPAWMVPRPPQGPAHRSLWAVPLGHHETEQSQEKTQTPCEWGWQGAGGLLSIWDLMGKAGLLEVAGVESLGTLTAPSARPRLPVPVVD